MEWVTDVWINQILTSFNTCMFLDTTMAIIPVAMLCMCEMTTWSFLLVLSVHCIISCMEFKETWHHYHQQQLASDLILLRNDACPKATSETTGLKNQLPINASLVLIADKTLQHYYRAKGPNHLWSQKKLSLTCMSIHDPFHESLISNLVNHSFLT